MAPEFPYEYTPTHPFLYQKEIKNLQYYILHIICIVTAPFLAIPKLLLVLIWMGVSAFFVSVFNVKNQNLPQSRIIYPIYRFFWWLVLKTQFIHIRIINKPKQMQPVLISNHTNMNDVVTHGVLLAPKYLARSDMFGAFGIGPVITANRSLSVQKNTSNAQLLDDMKRICDEFNTSQTPLQIFPEGTIAAEHCVLRFRAGAFRLNHDVQIVALKYKKMLHNAWLCQSGLRHLIDLSCNFASILEYIYLDVVKNETPDQAGKRLADTLGRVYLPYTNEDYQWFNGKCDSKDRCTHEYIKDFGWMGQIDEWKQKCSANNLDWRYFHEESYFKK
ncbi:Lysophosphatidylcholine acyltransferase/Lyso-PAF acetyltransferase [Spironucleus salmonicida]|uniref:Acyltransferase n=1 Tax=Spironucleus salmonicida TaxID=348837 RepID=V6LI34_9EUKA|nr:Lysophosphatidylcholine acyltransferase/Lyso-PAF acetyltransferase [Spironucleus salmonicida]|eukprot:EST43371.1 Acyltransferase [Spironucleus salmonicida]